MQNTQFQYRKQNGQTLIIMVFLMIAALAIGVSISNRFITTLSMTSDQYFGYQAQGVAEAAIERILTLSTSELQDFITHNSCGDWCTVSITGPDGVVQTAVVSLSTVGSGNTPYETRLRTDGVTEVNLDRYGNNKTMSICWNDPDEGDLPSVYATLVTGTVNSYNTYNFAYNSIGSLHSNGFTTATSANGFKNCMTVNTGNFPIIMRLRSIYNDIDVTIIPDSSATLPSQGILIESTGTVSDVVRKVSVIKSDNIVPLDFDYVLFQRSETEALSN